MKRKKLTYLGGIVSFLLIINIALLYKNNSLRKKPTFKIRSIPNFVLYDLEGKRFEYNKIINISGYTLIIFFSPTDCVSCLNEKKLWKRISDEKKINILGIARHIDKKELINWIKNSEIYFPILYDMESKITKMLGINITPTKILVNNKGHECPR